MCTSASALISCRERPSCPVRKESSSVVPAPCACRVPSGSMTSVAAEVRSTTLSACSVDASCTATSVGGAPPPKCSAGSSARCSVPREKRPCTWHTRGGLRVLGRPRRVCAGGGAACAKGCCVARGGGGGGRGPRTARWTRALVSAVTATSKPRVAYASKSRWRRGASSCGAPSSISSCCAVACLGSCGSGAKRFARLPTYGDSRAAASPCGRQWGRGGACRRSGWLEQWCMGREGGEAG